MTHPSSNKPPRTTALRGSSRALLIALGWLSVALGIVGAFLPVMPTTVFLLIALWAFSKSSTRFHDWLYNHPRFGPPLQAWTRERALPRRAKVLASVTISMSILWLAFFSSVPVPIVLSLAIGLTAIATWLCLLPTPGAAKQTSEM